MPFIGASPNPFTASTVLWYCLSKSERVRLGVFRRGRT